MIRNLLTSTAIATLVSTGAMAQTDTLNQATDPVVQQQQEPMVIRAEGHLASNIMGEAVYNGTGEEAERIGKVQDLVLDQEGEIQAIVVGVGGFLGIGQKEVALEYDLVEWAEQQDGNRWLVVETTADALKAQEEFDRTAYRPMPADADIAETKPATAEDLAAAPTQDGEDAQQTADAEAQMDVEGSGQDQQQAADTTPLEGEEGEMTASEDTQARPTEETAAAEDQGMAPDETQTAAIDRNNLQQAEPDQIRAENLTGTSVYGANEEDIGEIGDVVLTPEGEVDAVIVDVGGFLGLGEKEVAIGMDNLAFMTDQSGELYLYTEFTQEELEAQPEYDEATYAERREDMRMRVQ